MYSIYIYYMYYRIHLQSEAKKKRLADTYAHYSQMFWLLTCSQPESRQRNAWQAVRTGHMMMTMMVMMVMMFSH